MGQLNTAGVNTCQDATFSVKPVTYRGLGSERACLIIHIIRV